MGILKKQQGSGMKKIGKTVGHCTLKFKNSFPKAKNVRAAPSPTRGNLRNIFSLLMFTGQNGITKNPLSGIWVMKKPVQTNNCHIPDSSTGVWGLALMEKQ
jgi:hypothetical protein